MNNTAYVMVNSVMKTAILMEPLVESLPRVMVYPLPMRISISRNTRLLPASNRRPGSNHCGFKKLSACQIHVKSHSCHLPCSRIKTPVGRQEDPGYLSRCDIKRFWSAWKAFLVLRHFLQAEGEPSLPPVRPSQNWTERTTDVPNVSSPLSSMPSFAYLP